MGRNLSDTRRLVLGIESSCDETAAAVVRGDGEILSSVIHAQIDLHAAYGGVVPEIAARAHVEKLDLCVQEALKRAGAALGETDAIAVTAGPGLIGGLMAGVLTAQGLSLGSGKPILAINHLEGHALTARLTDGLDFPYLNLLVSGGHCLLLLTDGPGAHRRLGTTIDDAPGEAFDKVAKLLGLGYPGGPAVERLARGGDPDRLTLPRPLARRPGCDFSFSGLKTALRQTASMLSEEPGGITAQDAADLCAAFQQAVAETLARQSARAMRMFRELRPDAAPVLAVSGGVAANGAVRAALGRAAAETGFRVVAPPLSLCGDNAAMIAWAAQERLSAGFGPDETIAMRPRWPLDETALALVGSGRRGAKS